MTLNETPETKHIAVKNVDMKLWREFKAKAVLRGLTAAQALSLAIKAWARIK